MERQYIWFRTGSAFLAASFGVLLGSAAALYLLVTLPPVAPLQLAAVFLVYAIALLPAFVIDRRRRRPTR